jgi:predicted RNA methylase
MIGGKTVRNCEPGEGVLSSGAAASGPAVAAGVDVAADATAARSAASDCFRESFIV